MFRYLYERKILKSIQKAGLALLEDDGGPNHPPYVYTAGLWESYKTPELVTCSLTQDLASGAFSYVVQQIGAGALVLSDNVRLPGVIENFDCALRRVHTTQLTGDHFGAALWYHSYRTGSYDGLEMYQLVWPDMAGRFPWEDGCAVQARFDQIPLYLPRDPENPDG